MVRRRPSHGGRLVWVGGDDRRGNQAIEGEARVGGQPGDAEQVRARSAGNQPVCKIEGLNSDDGEVADGDQPHEAASQGIGRQASHLTRPAQDIERDVCEEQRTQEGPHPARAEAQARHRARQDGKEPRDFVGQTPINLPLPQYSTMPSGFDRFGSIQNPQPDIPL